MKNLNLLKTIINTIILKILHPHLSPTFSSHHSLHDLESSLVLPSRIAQCEQRFCRFEKKYIISKKTAGRDWGLGTRD